MRLEELDRRARMDPDDRAALAELRRACKRAAIPRERDAWPTCRQFAGFKRHLAVEAEQEMFGIRILTACKKEMRGDGPASVALNLHDDEPWDRRRESMDCGHCQHSKAMSYIAGRRIHPRHRGKISPYLLDRYGIDYGTVKRRFKHKSYDFHYFTRADHDGPKP